MSKKSYTSEDYYNLLNEELNQVLNAYDEYEYLTCMAKAVEFQEWCSHTFNNGESAIVRGLNKDLPETWSQCKMCKTNIF